MSNEDLRNAIKADPVWINTLNYKKPILTFKIPIIILKKALHEASQYLWLLYNRFTSLIVTNDHLKLQVNLENASYKDIKKLIDIIGTFDKNLVAMLEDRLQEIDLKDGWTFSFEIKNNKLKEIQQEFKDDIKTVIEREELEFTEYQFQADTFQELKEYVQESIEKVLENIEEPIEQDLSYFLNANYVSSDLESFMEKIKGNDKLTIATIDSTSITCINGKGLTGNEYLKNASNALNVEPQQALKILKELVKQQA